MNRFTVVLVLIILSCKSSIVNTDDLIVYNYSNTEVIEKRIRLVVDSIDRNTKCIESINTRIHKDFVFISDSCFDVKVDICEEISHVLTFDRAGKLLKVEYELPSIE